MKRPPRFKTFSSETPLEWWQLGKQLEGLIFLPQGFREQATIMFNFLSVLSSLCPRHCESGDIATQQQP